jgi:predicted ArsR family transcriptional regulator
MPMPEAPWFLIERVSEYLETSGPVTIEDMASDLDMSEYAVELALTWLQRNGYAEPVSEDGFTAGSRELGQ